MIETKISIDSIIPVDFYGVNNTKLQFIQNFFPKMTISARGNKIICKSDTKDIILIGNYNKIIKEIEVKKILYPVRSLNMIKIINS